MLHSIVASKITGYLNAHGMGAPALSAAIREGRSIVSEAVSGFTAAQVRALPATYQTALLAWDHNDFHAVLQAMAATHRAHADVLVEQHTFWRYFVVEMRKAQEFLRRACA